jgi:dTDP-4-dehydrorhamnose 3,5-epimerase
MLFTQLKVNGAFVVEPKRFSDDRGYFQENFKLPLLQQATSFDFQIKQVNQSKSSAGVVRDKPNT